MWTRGVVPLEVYSFGLRCVEEEQCLGVVRAGGLRLDYRNVCGLVKCCLVPAQALSVTTRNLRFPASLPLTIWLHLCVYQVHVTLEKFFVGPISSGESDHFPPRLCSVQGVAREVGFW